MNFSAVINSATMGRPERVRPLIVWTILEYLLRGAPYGTLLLVVWELFKPLQYPVTQLDVQRTLCWTGALLVSLVLLLLVSRKAYFAAYKDSYEICADGRLKIAEHLRRLSMGFHNTRDPGDIGAYLVTDYTNIEQMLSHQFPQMCGAFATPAILLICPTFISWKLALAAALVIPLAWPAAWISLASKRMEVLRKMKMKRCIQKRIVLLAFEVLFLLPIGIHADGARPTGSRSRILSRRRITPNRSPGIWTRSACLWMRPNSGFWATIWTPN